MPISLLDNLDIKKRSPDVARQQFLTIADMVAFREDYLPDIYEAFCLEDGNKYRFRRTNDVDPTTGKWRVVTEGGMSDLPTASATIKGGVKIGAGLTMEGETLKADVQSDENFTTELKEKLEDIDMSTKVDVEEGKGLSTNDLTDELKAQYDKAEENVQSDWNQDDDTKDDFIKNKPTLLSQFENDSKFVEETTENLENYYKKTETYSQTEIEALVNAVNSFKVEKVASYDDLPPIEDADKKTFYLVPKGGTGSDSYYEYICIDDKWEPIGSTTASSGSALETEIVTNVECGGIASGTKLIAGTTFEDIFNKLLVKYINPTVSLKLSVGSLRAKWNPLTSVTLTSSGSKGTSDIENVKLYDGTTLIETQDSFGAFDYTPETSITANTTFKAVATDVKGKSSQATSSVSFIIPYYYGVSASDSLTDPTTLTEDLASKGNKTYKFTANEQYFYIAYDYSYGSLSSVLDSTGFENIDNFTKVGKVTVTKNGNDYDFMVYRSTSVQTQTNFSLTFKL